MRKRVLSLWGLVVVAMLAVPGVAGANTVALGTTTQPSGSSTDINCFMGTSVLAQLTSDPSTPYMAPVGGGEITQWQTNTSGATAGSEVTFVVLRPNGSNWTVVGADSETLPSPLPGSGIASYTLASPIVVQGGDTLGLWTPSGSKAVCYWYGGSTPEDDSLTALPDSSTPTAGQSVPYVGDDSGPNYTADVSATLVQSEDAAVTTSTSSNAATGYPAVLSSTVSNNAGPSSGPITFTDHVPSGLAVDSASIASGSCAVSGQTVTCTSNNLPPGQSDAVSVVVTPHAAGSYANSVSVAPPSGVSDPNPANNTASATLKVGSAPPVGCVVPKLKGTPGKVAKHVLKLLGCKVKIKHAHSNKIAKGKVIKTKPKAGTYKTGRKITLVVSSGP